MVDAAAEIGDVPHAVLLAELDELLTCGVLDASGTGPMPSLL